jgi:hypothetical protein
MLQMTETQVILDKRRHPDGHEHRTPLVYFLFVLLPSLSPNSETMLNGKGQSNASRGHHEMQKTREDRNWLSESILLSC